MFVLKENLTNSVEIKERETANMNKKKMQFEVQENESIEQCLQRMKQLGYEPVRRIEKPIFQEIKRGGETIYEPIGRQIVFEGKIIQ
jgi:hypothetical protein